MENLHKKNSFFLLHTINEWHLLKKNLILFMIYLILHYNNKLFPKKDLLNYAT